MSEKHGTRSGYMAHCTAREEPCAACRRAQREYMRAFNKRKKTGKCAKAGGMVPGRMTGLGWPL